MSSFSASEKLMVRAKESLLLQCGDSSIELTPDKIVLHAPSVELSAAKSMSVSTTDGPSMSIGDKMEILAKKFGLFTQSGAVEVDTDFKVSAKSIQLGYDPSKPAATSDTDSADTKPFSCKFSDYFLQAYSGKKFHLMSEGLRFEGATDGDGFVKQDIPKDARQVVVRLWLDQYPEGRQRQYTLNLGTLPPTSDVVGAKQRLKNLGYFEGDLDANTDDDFKLAVSDFQDDHKDSHGLDVNGSLDGATSGALEEIHGS
jgi:hypothetical protein